MSGPKPGDPEFIPRYPPLDLGPIQRRIEERQAATLLLKENHAEAVRADTEIMQALLLNVRNLRAANQNLKDVIRAMQVRLVDLQRKATENATGKEAAK